KLMKAYEIVNGMIDTLDIFLESEQNEGDRENYEFVMEFLKDELQSKSSNIIKYIRNVSLEVEVLSQEEDRLEKLRKQKEKKVNSLKKYLTDILLNLDKNKIETELGNLGLRKSVSVAIDNLDLIPKKYIQKKIELVPDKRMLSEILKQGKNIKGVHLEDKYSLQIR
ncbi:MAG: siphovirus Gp157 family protein, partial [Cetobacterium sp.]|uniref:siphovirus Gp157 family protein n=1 Tax=Cetobacterium sp. TaxID=2071632 RepID=UPI003EE6A852